MASNRKIDEKTKRAKSTRKSNPLFWAFERALKSIPRPHSRFGSTLQKQGPKRGSKNDEKSRKRGLAPLERRDPRVNAVSNSSKTVENRLKSTEIEAKRQPKASKMANRKKRNVID